MAVSEKKLSELVSADHDREKNNYYRKKLKALNALKSGNSYYAYYAFKELHRDYPDDKDISFYFSESKTVLRRIISLLMRLKK